ncbi:MAG: helix-turn-helix domain-containing protein [candidate division Zixibacteria bacterium]|nr:helix-turn-helix domain-containing protein [candidate division Zixibacteria bacterium]
MNEIRAKLGELLLLERKRRNLDLEDLSKELKIPLESLEAVEEGNIDNLPSELYFGLFAKAYCEAVGIDYQRTLEAITEELGELVDRPTGKPRAEQKKGKAAKDSSQESTREQIEQPTPEDSATNIKKLGLWLGIAVVAFVIFVFVSKLISTDGDETDPNPTEQTESHDIDRPEDNTAPEESNVYADYDWDTPAYQRPEPFTLRLVARGESWATILTDGDTAIFRKLFPGREYEATAKYRMRVSVAVPSLVDIQLNGQTVDLVDPARRRISRVRITQINLDSILNQPTPPQDSVTLPETNTTPEQSQETPDSTENTADES